jgi:hypothetical protein
MIVKKKYKRKKYMVTQKDRQRVVVKKNRKSQVKLFGLFDRSLPALLYTLFSPLPCIIPFERWMV